jgi:hypothetical protein
MGVTVNGAELRKILELTPEAHNIMLVGKHGIGKSRIMTDFFTEKGKKVVTLFLGQMSDPGDLIGLPCLDAQTKRTEFRPPWWFPADGKPIVLFLDELNRARPEILQCVMDLTLNKTLAGRHLPEGSRIISAVNEGEEYQLTDLDPAMISRFNIYYFSPTPGEWLLWAEKNKIDKRITGFIGENSDCLDAEAAENPSLSKTSDRRSWERVSQLIGGLTAIDQTVSKAIAGIVGSAAALKFTNYLKENSKINAKLILENFKKNRKLLEPLTPHELAILNEGAFRALELEESAEVIKSWMENLEMYIKWLFESERREVLAHWITQYESPLYPKTRMAVLQYSSCIYKTAVTFIENIKV